MLDKGDKLPKIVPQRGCTPLHVAAYDGYLDLANFLLEKGADPTITDDKNRTPLHIAAYRGHMPIIARLLLCCIDVNAQDEYGNTFLHKLVDNKQLTLGERLKRFTEVMKGIENNHHSFLKRVDRLMLDCCPVLNNNIDTESLLTMVVDYIQGVDLTLKNQAGKATLAIIQEALTAAPRDEAYAEVVKILARHQELGGWLRSYAYA